MHDCPFAARPRRESPENWLGVQSAASKICRRSADALVREVAGGMIFVVSGCRFAAWTAALKICVAQASSLRPFPERGRPPSARWLVVMPLTFPGTAGALAGRGGKPCDLHRFRVRPRSCPTASEICASPVPAGLPTRAVRAVRGSGLQARRRLLRRSRPSGRSWTAALLGSILIGLSWVSLSAQEEAVSRDGQSHEMCTQNLLPNPSFEEGITDWRVGSGREDYVLIDRQIARTDEARPARPEARPEARPPAAAEVPDQHCQRGKQMKDERRYAEAAQALRAAIEADPKHVEAHWVLAWTLVELKDVDGAKAEFCKVIELAPDSERATEARKALERLDQ